MSCSQVLLLDEATSALDAQSEGIVQVDSALCDMSTLMFHGSFIALIKFPDLILLSCLSRNAYKR